MVLEEALGCCGDNLGARFVVVENGATVGKATLADLTADLAHVPEAE